MKMQTLDAIEIIATDATPDNDTEEDVLPFYRQLAYALQPFLTYAQKTKIKEDFGNTVVLFDSHSGAKLTAKHFQSLLTLIEEK